MSTRRLTARRRTRRGQSGFSTVAMAFVLLALMLPIVLIAEGVLVAGRQATSNALGQENLRAVDGALDDTITDVRLDAGAAGTGCQSGSASATFTSARPRPQQGPLTVNVVCAVESVSAAERILDFDAQVSTGAGSKSLGKARVRYIDQLGASDEPGAEMLVCDWKLGEDSSTLSSC